MTDNNNKTVIEKKSAGPIVIKGEVELKDDKGNILPHPPVFSLCGCGKSQKTPFCDGSHKF